MSKFERLSEKKYKELEASNQPKDQATILTDEIKGIIVRIF